MDEDFVVILVGIACLLALIFIPAMWLDSASCASQARAMSVEQTWGPLQGCVIKVGDKWLPLKNYRGFEEAK